MVSRTIANAINGALFGQQASIPTISTWYFGLCRTAPTINASGDGVPQNEVTNAGYERVAITNTTANFNTPTFDAEKTLSFVSNKTVITMPVITGGADVDVPYFFLSRSKTAATCDIWGRFTNTRHLSVDSQLIVNPGGAVFELTNVAQ